MPTMRVGPQMQTHSKEGNARRYERLIAHTKHNEQRRRNRRGRPYRCARYRPQNRPRMHRRRDAVKRKRPTQHAPGVSEDKFLRVVEAAA